VLPAIRPPAGAVRRLPALRTHLPPPSRDADYLRLPVGAGALHALRYGHGGPAILLVHGFTTNATLWRRVAPLLLADGFQVIVPDLMGFGESDRPIGAPYTVLAQARHLDRALALLRLPSVIAVGQDFGAAVVQRLATLRPDRVSQLVLVSPPGPGDAPEVDSVRSQTGPALLDISSRALGIVDLMGPALREAVSDPTLITSARVARYAAPYAGREGARHLLDLARAAAEQEAPESIPRLVVPRHVLTGMEDIVQDVGADAASERIKGTRRLLPEEAPEAVAATIRRLAQPAAALESRGSIS
jgi:pimeloyl-ACP methyl ester carboxylesterase